MNQLYKKPIVMISFRENGQNGGPYNSHLRITQSKLNEFYQFIPLIIPNERFGLFNLRIIKSICNQIKAINPDIVHFAGLQLEGFHLAIACRLSGIKKSVVAIHGSSMESTELSKWKKLIIKVLEIITLKLTTSSYGVSDYVGSWKLINFSKSYYGTIYNLSHLVNDITIAPTIRDELQIRKTDILITSTGRITVEKGYQVLLKIILDFNIPQNVKFIIVGNGPYLETFQHMIILNSKQNSVFCLGYREDINRILSVSDIFIMPSLHETFCMSVLEACFHGIPSIVTNVGGLSEIVKHGFNGFLVDSLDSHEFIKYLECLINNEPKRRIMGENAKRGAETNFKQEDIIYKINKLYRQMLD